ncbi:MAG: hypothetical protein JWO41_382 [Candidatus Saccharibacteria bacterium]|nr:hypothetical protein [Candidatus Saccharibacteria bacterium]
MTEIGCPFCNPLERIVKSNSTAQVILSDPRKIPGHTLVMPKRHVEKPWELTAEELSDIYALIFDVEQKLINGKLGDGVDVRQNYRPFMQQSKLKLDHVHFHVVPRSLEDYIYAVSEKYDTELFAELDDDEREAVTKLIED